MNGEKGHSSEVNHLIEENDDINIKDGKNALIMAAKQGDLEMVKLLVEKKKVNINETNKDGKTALMIANEQGHYDVVDYLIVKNVDINNKNNKITNINNDRSDIYYDDYDDDDDDDNDNDWSYDSPEHLTTYDGIIDDNDGDVDYYDLY